jgi:hypothetical protein
MTQLLHIFRDCGLIPEASQKRKPSSFTLHAATSTEPSARYEAAIEKCPLLMSFEQFYRFLDSLLSDDPSAQLLEKLALLVVPVGGKYEGHWIHIHPECAELLSPSPLQLESVISSDPLPDLSSLSLLSSTNGSRPTRSVALIWERNLEQMKQLYNYYSLSHSNSLSKMTKKKNNLFVTFDSYRELLQDFDIFPSIVDQKVPRPPSLAY